MDQLYREEVEEARAMLSEEKLLAGARLFDYACAITAAGIRHQNPCISEVEIQRILCERLQLLRRLEDHR